MCSWSNEPPEHDIERQESGRVADADRPSVAVSKVQSLDARTARSFGRFHELATAPCAGAEYFTAGTWTTHSSRLQEQ